MIVPMLLAAAIPFVLAGDQESPLLGKALPKLELAHSLQGTAWSPEDFVGQVTVLDFFQLG